MAESPRQPLVFADEQRCCTFANRCPAGPAALDVAARPLFAEVRTCFAEAVDRTSTWDSGRAFHKGGADVVLSAGRLAPGVTVRHTTRLAASFLRLTTDLTVKRDVALEGELAVGSLDLPADLVAWRRWDLGAPGFSAPEPLPDTVCLDGDTLALVFHRADGVALEIGLGNDLWRWWTGLFGHPGQFAWQLTRTAAGWHLHRPVTRTTAATPVRARDYRFSWYAAWETPDERACPLPATLVPAAWTPAGDLDLDALLPHLGDADAAVEIDLRTLPGPDSLHRSPDGVGTGPLPCLAAGPTVKRLKRLVRQVAEIEGGFGIVFANARAGFCRTGRHLGRRESAAHWDVAGLLEFGLWARRTLGPDRPLRARTDAADGPALRQLFTPAHHLFPG